MAFVYPKPVEYALRSLTYLATHPDKDPISVHEIAEAENVSAHHLSKVMKILSFQKWLKSTRGPGGGYLLVVDPAELTLWDVLGAFGYQIHIDECVLGKSECSDEDPCMLHARWDPIRGSIRSYFHEVTIQELAEVEKGQKESDERKENDPSGNRIPAESSS